MKTSIHLALAVSLTVFIHWATAQGTAFTYQGRLNLGANPATGVLSMEFQRFRGPAGDVPLSPVLAFPAVPVTNGLFSVLLDFGPLSSFDEQSYWLGITVNGTPLIPRQRITPAPYAVFSAEAASVRNPTFIGTTGNQPFELTVGGLRALRIEPMPGGAPNMIGGASVNRVTAGVVGATIGGGGATNYGFGTRINEVMADFGTVGGGFMNTVNGQWGTVAGGSRNIAGSYGSVGGGSRNVAGPYSTVGGGEVNDAFGSQSTVAGGFQNRSSGNWSAIAGGRNNTANGDSSSVGGGNENTANGTFATVPGGTQNGATDYAFAAGRRAKAVHPGAFVWADSTDADFVSTTNNEFSLRALGGVRMDAGGGGARIQPTLGTPNIIAGAGVNFVNALSVLGAVIGGGGSVNSSNMVTGNFGTVAGGTGNRSADYSVVSGGLANTSVSGATVAGGRANTAGGGESAIGGGGNNTTVGAYATIPGGFNNSATHHSFAAGRQAKAMHPGTFVWADATEAEFASTGENQFNIRATGGLRLSDNTPHLSFGNTTRQMLNLWGDAYGVGVQGGTLYFRTDGTYAGAGEFAWYRGGIHSDAQTNAGGGQTLMRLNQTGLFVNGVLASSSDRDTKQDFVAVNVRGVLDKVAALPLSSWSYKTDAAIRHMGPMAQDFRSAFGLGTDDKHIATIDASGVALAAIQGLNQKLADERKRLDAENAELRSELVAIKVLLTTLMKTRE